MSCVLGLTACVGSMILLVFAMKANYAATGQAYGGDGPSGVPAGQEDETFFRHVLGSGST